MTDVISATVSSDGPLQGAELRIEVLRDWAEVYVHLDAIGTHAAQWVALTDVDRILGDLSLDDANRDIAAHRSLSLDEASAVIGHTIEADIRLATDLVGEARETVHACPLIGSGVTPCCGRTPFELPGTDRMTLDPSLVSCPDPTTESSTLLDAADPLAEVARPHDARAVARTERRHRDAG